MAMTDDNKLVKACKRGLEDDVIRLLKGGANLNTISAIHYAAERGSKAIVQALLDARSGHEDVIKQLLENGADVNANDENH
ncbi:uncharacterized protein N7498_006384 [Penicillium cinerascens]|uniref:Uncharacterized protein n=1 Tax=Penicillium cinerascens TaxID=70096 RepID=A0A9W9MI09_9EURO|nr:uncharacterized protein N7498_006384 [Penicillium cinerascens]KAJ5201721.1 hypothetical protein N7498_006384 [Penicillium cinerascens]